MKYKIWLDEWLRLYVKSTVKNRTYSKYQRLIHLHIVPSLGDFRIEELSAFVLQSYIVKLNKEYSANTVIGIILLLKNNAQLLRIYETHAKRFFLLQVISKILMV